MPIQVVSGLTFGHSSMPVNRLLLAEYERLSDPEKESCLRGLAEVARGPLNGELDELDSEIASFELRYQISTETMRKRLYDGVLDLTPDIGHWQILAELRDRAQRAK
jgi:hypothetical protein